MTKEKQIEEMQEMANILTEAAHLACEDIPLMPTDMYICHTIPCHRCKEVRLLSYKGYRKASDVTREIFEEIEEYLECIIAYVSREKEKHYGILGGCTYDTYTSYLDGELIIAKNLQDLLAGLKKKFTEGEG